MESPDWDVQDTKSVPETGDEELEGALNEFTPDDEIGEGDPVTQAKERNKERLSSDDPTKKKKGLRTANLQDNIYRTLKYFNEALDSATSQDIDTYDEDEVHNLSILWGEYAAQEASEDAIMEFIRKAPLITAGGYTAVITIPKLKKAWDSSNISNFNQNSTSNNE